MLTLKTVVCPGCGEHLAADNNGCSHCGWEDSRNDYGRIESLQDYLSKPTYPAPGALKLGDVCSAFLRALADAAVVQRRSLIAKWLAHSAPEVHKQFLAEFKE